MSNTTRQPGYYWVRRTIESEWIAAKWRTEKGIYFWGVDGLFFQDADFSEINETRIIDPDEQEAQREVQREQHKRDVVNAWLHGAEHGGRPGATSTTKSILKNTTSNEKTGHSI